MANRQDAGFLRDATTGALVVSDPYSLASQPTPLKRFRQALTTIETAQFSWLAVGDSITESSGATKLDRGWIELVRTHIQRNYMTAGKGGFGFLNTYAKTNPSLNGSGSGVNYWTWSGGGAGATGQSPAFIATRRYVNVANETATLTFTGTAFKIHYGRGAGPNANPFTVAVDAGSAITVTPAASPTDRQGVYSITGLTSGAHSVVVTPNAGKILPIDGATVYDGDEANGIVLVNDGRFGSTSADHIGVSMALTDPIAIFPNPALVTIHLGTNDPSNSIAAATTATNVQTVIANIKALCTITPSFLVIGPSERSTVDAATWQTYLSALQGVANADPTNVAFLDLTKHFIDLPAAGNNWLQGLYNSDGTHPTDAGYRLIAGVVAQFLLGDVRAAIS